MTAVIVQADARALPLPDASVDLVVTSPPYYALRSYTDGGQHYDAQIGSEATPAEWLANMWDCTREMIRVLKPEGSIFVNLGDKYANDGPSGPPGKNTGVSPAHNSARAIQATRGRRFDHGQIRPKSLIGLPWRYALGCIDQLGLILRAEIIWSKPNGLPESVTDRVRRSHEQWFHFTKQPRYYSAVDEIREPHAPWTLKAYAYEQANEYKRKSNVDRVDRGNAKDYAVANPLGKLPGSVWSVPSEPLTVPAELGVDHFAAFPSEWPRRLILGWSPPGICTACGQGRRPIADVSYSPAAKRGGDGSINRNRAARSEVGDETPRSSLSKLVLDKHTTITGYACACPEPTAPTRPSLILDPFGGTGTTALVASVLGRVGISVDRSADYCRLARWRTTDPGERAKAMRVDKPPVQVDGQLDLLAVGE